MTVLILASQSTARADILKGAGIAFEAIPSDVDEATIKADLLNAGATPAHVAEALAAAKALRVSEGHAGRLVLGADQTLDLRGRLIDKADSRARAQERLMVLRGRTHRLHAAVAIARDGVVLWRDLQSARLTMRDFSDAYLRGYMTRNAEALTRCVGAYQLEGEGVQLFDAIDGDYFTILGLPILGLFSQLRLLGVLER